MIRLLLVFKLTLACYGLLCALSFAGLRFSSIWLNLLFSFFFYVSWNFSFDEFWNTSSSFAGFPCLGKYHSSPPSPAFCFFLTIFSSRVQLSYWYYLHCQAKQNLRYWYVRPPCENQRGAMLHSSLVFVLHQSSVCYGNPTGDITLGISKAYGKIQWSRNFPNTWKYFSRFYWIVSHCLLFWLCFWRVGLWHVPIGNRHLILATDRLGRGCDSITRRGESMGVLLSRVRLSRGWGFDKSVYQEMLAAFPSLEHSPDPAATTPQTSRSWDGCLSSLRKWPRLGYPTSQYTIPRRGHMGHSVR